MKTLSRTFPLLLVLLCWLMPAQAAEIAGTLRWAQRTELGTTVNGIVTSVHVQVGDSVAKDALLLKLDDREFAADVARARAALEEARHLKEEAERELERNRELYDRTVLSDHDLRMAEIAAAAASAAWHRAQAELTAAEIRLQRTAIRAPFDAHVIDLPKRAGEAVINNLGAPPLVIVAAAKQMELVATVDARTAAAAAAGDSVEIRIGDQVVTGRVATIAMEPATGEAKGYPVIAQFSVDDANTLRAGENATLILP